MPNEVKHATPDHPIHEVVAKRWSPYVFSDKPVSAGDIHRIFEAARWSASSYNEQPWRYIVATKDQPELFAKVLSCLMPMNQAWAKAAPVLALGCTHLNFTHSGKPNAVALHDLGLASATLSFEATAIGLHVHQMAGILPDVVRSTFHVPPEFQPLTAIAIGYAADPSTLPDDHPLKPRDVAPRARKPLAEILFGSDWGVPAKV